MHARRRGGMGGRAVEQVIQGAVPAWCDGYGYGYGSGYGYGDGYGSGDGDIT